MEQEAVLNNPTHQLCLAQTDAQMPVHWRSGSLKYEQFEPLGQGGVATVERCWDQNLRRHVAIKRLHPEYSDDEVLTRRFLREARVTAIIPHPGTVPIYELGRDRTGSLFFTMKLLAGRDLGSILADLEQDDAQTRAHFPLTRLIDILIDCGQTVGFAHRQGVIHRDLKPANIQVGNFGEVKVLDWGLAKVCDEPDLPSCEIPTARETADRELTRPGSRCGTPLYMSPEQARGDLDVDERTDVYNIGVILFEMLTNQPLVEGETAEQLIDQTINQPARMPSTIVPDRWVPAELEAICLKALSKDRQRRYPTMNAMVSDLLAFRRGQPVTAYCYSRIDRLKRWRKKHLLLLAAGLGLAGGIGIGMMIAALGLAIAS